MIKSIYNNQTELIQNIIDLHIPTKQIDLDPTYSKGNFYKNITSPFYKFDIYPQTEDTIESDCRFLPLENESVNSIMFDPPFLATTGKSLSTNKGNIITRRFSCFSSECELFQFYIDSLKEFYRILKTNGILIFKCQDKVSSGKQYFAHCFILQEAEKIGFYAKDFFILTAKNRLTPDWQVKNQKHARKFHCYFWVFSKEKQKIKYIK